MSLLIYENFRSISRHVIIITGDIYLIFQGLFFSHNAEIGRKGRKRTGSLMTLPFRFTLSASTDGSQLGDVLELVAWTGAATCTPAPPTSAARWWPLGASSPDPETGRVATPTSGALAPGESSLLCMRAELPLSAPSSVQGQRLDLLVTVDAEHDVAASELASELEAAP